MLPKFTYDIIAVMHQVLLFIRRESFCQTNKPTAAFNLKNNNFVNNALKLSFIINKKL